MQTIEELIEKNGTVSGNLIGVDTQHHQLSAILQDNEKAVGRLETSTSSQ